MDIDEAIKVLQSLRERQTEHTKIEVINQSSGHGVVAFDWSDETVTMHIKHLQPNTD